MLPKINKMLAKSTIEYQNNLGSNADGKNELSDRISIKVMLIFKEMNKSNKEGYQIKGDNIVFYYLDGDLDINGESQVFITNNGVEENYKVEKTYKPRDPFNGKIHHTKVVLQ